MSVQWSFTLRARFERFELEVSCESDARALGLFGASGAGKSSVVEALAGWRAVDEGRCVVGGELWLDSSNGVALPPAQRRVGYVPQDLLLFPHLDVEANVRFGAQSDDATVERALEVLEIAPLRSRDVESLSGGERQRVALARALCAKPRVLLLDEPLGALDRPLRRRILPHLLRVRDEFQTPMLIVSHDPTEILACCEHVLVLERGRVVASGPPVDVLGPDSGRADGDNYENVLRGVVESVSENTARVDLGGAVLEVPRADLQPGASTLVAVRADDVLVAVSAPQGLSARNVLPARIDRVVGGPQASVRASLGQQTVWIDLTDGAIRELGLVAGLGIVLIIKTRACRVLGSERTA